MDKGKDSLERFLPRVSAYMLPEVWECGEDAHTPVLMAVEGVAVVQTLVGAQPGKGERRLKIK